MNNISEKIKRCLIKKSYTIFQALEIVGKGYQIALIVDENGKLIGTVTDGDIRRSILHHVPMDKNVLKIANLKPTTVLQGTSNDKILELMVSTKLSQIPVVDKKGKIIDLKILNELVRPAKKFNPVVIMAGGYGRRLRPYTQNTPKPLLNVGNFPIIQTIIEEASSYGFSNFYVSLNYKSEMLKKFLKDGSHFNISIKYIEEEKQLGTAGALSLIQREINQPILVINGDILTKVNFESLLNFHYSQKSEITVTCKKYRFQLPYGVLKIDKNGVRVASIQEKPVGEHLINAGIYVLNPEVIRRIPYNKRYDMTELLLDCMKLKNIINAFPIHEYWLDIGSIEDYNTSQEDYYIHFKKRK